jgi:hypothetical protein
MRRQAATLPAAALRRGEQPAGRTARRLSRSTARSRGRHLAARVGAPPTGVGASLHRLVVAHRRAGFGAAIADVGADPANRSVAMGSAAHEPARGGADLRAVEQQDDVLRRGVRASLLQAVRNCLQASPVTGVTVLDTARHLVVHVVRHRSVLPFSPRLAALRGPVVPYREAGLARGAGLPAGQQRGRRGPLTSSCATTSGGAGRGSARSRGRARRWPRHCCPRRCRPRARSGTPSAWSRTPCCRPR